jgi:hypothetical protein
VKAATSSIPIVFIAHANPVRTGHVASLARPGGNVTGLSVLQTELGPKGLELLRSAVPAAARIAVLWHPGTPSHAPGLKALEESARMLRLQLQPVGAGSVAELEGAFSTMARGGAQAILVLGTPFFFTARERLGGLAIAHRLPTMFQGRPGSGDRVTAKHWLVTCSCGWEREAVSEWAAQPLSTLHPQLAPMDVAHVTRVEGPDQASAARQLTLT